MDKTIIIAEAGVNHNGSLELAKQLVDIAAEAKADYVKFQTFRAEKNISAKAPKANYQEKVTGKEESQLEMVKKLELSVSDHEVLFDYCKAKNIGFLSTAFDHESVDLLERFGMDYFKVPSGEITNLPLLRRIADTGKKVIISTGMASIPEIRAVLDVFYRKGYQKDQICVLHCNTEYPTPLEDVNLKAMDTIRDEFGVEVGYSDHSMGIVVPLAAVARGARVIEKHFTIDASMEGPDHQASLVPRELKEMVDTIRDVEKLLGSGEKKPSASEEKNLAIARKSIHVMRDVKQGEVLKEEDLIMLRPGSGISPMEIDNIIGKTVVNDIESYELLKMEDLK